MWPVPRTPDSVARAGRAIGLTESVLAANLVCVVGSMMFVLAPLLVDALRRQAGASEPQVAWLGSADPTGMFCGAVLALLTVPRLDRRMLAGAGLLFLALGDAIAMGAPTLSGVAYGSRLLAGAGGGLAMGVAYAAFGSGQQPERVYALFGLLQTLVGSAAIAALAPLVARFGPAAIYAMSLALAVLGLTVTALIDPRAAPPRPTVTARHAQGLLGPLVVVTYVLFGMTGLAVWANAQTLGRSLGLSTLELSGALSLSLVGSVAGSVLVVVTGHRWGRALPTTVLAGGFVGGIGLLTVAAGYWGFLVAVTAYQFGTNMGSPAFGAISAADPLGRLSVVYLLSLKAGFALGPAAAAWLVGSRGFDALWSDALGLALAVTALLAVTLRVAKTVPDQ